MIEEFYKSTKGVNLAQFAVDEARSMTKAVESTINLLIELSGSLNAALELLRANNIDNRIGIREEEVLDHLSDLHGIAYYLDSHVEELEYMAKKAAEEEELRNTGFLPPNEPKE